MMAAFTKNLRGHLEAVGLVQGDEISLHDLADRNPIYELNVTPAIQPDALARQPQAIHRIVLPTL